MDEDRVRERAYLLWEQAGRPDGSEETFWFAAIASLEAEGPAQAAEAAQPEATQPEAAQPSAKSVPPARIPGAASAANVAVSSRTPAKATAKPPGAAQKAAAGRPLAASDPSPVK
jgi:hypothetical protein